MPIRRSGYHRWEGELSGSRFTWLAILSSGLRLGFQQKYTQQLLYSSFSIALAAGVFFYGLEVFRESQEQTPILGILSGFLGMRQFDEAFFAHLTLPVWTLIFIQLCRIELVWVMLMLARVGPDLIAGDLRANALPIYFSKPITVTNYLAGKWLINVVFALLVTLLPNLLAFMVGILLSGSLDQLLLTSGLLWRLAVQGVIVTGVASIVMLALSALIRDGRFVAIAWLALALVPRFIQTRILDPIPGSAQNLLGAVALDRNLQRITYHLLGIRPMIENLSLRGEAVTEGGGLFGGFGLPFLGGLANFGDRTSEVRGLLMKAAGGEALGEGLWLSVAVTSGVVLVAMAICLRRIRRFMVSSANA